MTRAGFSLVELLVALTLAALGVTIAASIYLHASDVVGRISAASIDREERALAMAWLTQALNGAAVTADPAAPFRGSETEMRFRSVLWVPEGWQSATDVTVSMDDDELRLEVGSGRDVVLLDSLRAVAFDYAGALGGANLWLRSWDSFAAPPLALRLRLTSDHGVVDTMLIYVGER
jgi:prepilin-type N-terminal cleavage/methylation domain-containing protein